METLKDACETEVRLLEGLCSCLQEERECLIAGNVRALWSLFEKKERLCEQLKVLERLIEEKTREMRKRGKRSGPEWMVLSMKRIAKLKAEVALRNSENMEIVQDMLDFIDGLIDTIMRPQVQFHDYGRSQAMNSYPRMVFKEV